MHDLLFTSLFWHASNDIRITWINDSQWTLFLCLAGTSRYFSKDIVPINICCQYHMRIVVVPKLSKRILEFFLLFILAILACTSWLLRFELAFAWWLIKMNTFSYVYWPFAYLHLWSVCMSICHFSFAPCVYFSLYNLDKSLLYRQIFSPILWLAFLHFQWSQFKRSS